jgi:chromosome segregation ATPase
MGYALFAQRKVELTGNLNAVTLQQTQRSNEQYLLATQTLSLQQQLTSLNSAQSLELADLYETLSNTTDSSGRDSINAQIKQKENEYEAEIDQINRQIYVVSVKENAIEMEVKRLDTQVTSIQKQLEAVEEAESSAIDRATPKFNGVG